MNRYTIEITEAKTPDGMTGTYQRVTIVKDTPDGTVDVLDSGPLYASTTARSAFDIVTDKMEEHCARLNAEDTSEGGELFGLISAKLVQARAGIDQLMAQLQECRDQKARNSEMYEARAEDWDKQAKSYLSRLEIVSAEVTETEHKLTSTALHLGGALEAAREAQDTLATLGDREDVKAALVGLRGLAKDATHADKDLAIEVLFSAIADLPGPGALQSAG